LGFLKDKVYENSPNRLEEVKQNIQPWALRIADGTLHWFASNMRKN
jgi:hypothetical protein